MSSSAPSPTATPAAESPALARMRPASALGNDVRRFFHLTYTLAVMEFKLRYYGSVLGYVWSLMRPLMLFGVLYVVFTHIIRFGSNIPDYPMYLLTALVLWNYFSETTAAAVTCLVTQENLIRKIRFPRAVIPLSISLQSFFNLGLNGIAVLGFAFASGIYPTLAWLELTPLIALLVVFTIGVSMMLAALYVRFRDIGMIWEVGQQILFWGSPIIYAIQTVPDTFERKLMANPIAAIITQVRHAMIDPSAPTAAAAMGGASRLLIPAGILVAAVLFGFWLFSREAPTIAENL